MKTSVSKARWRGGCRTGAASGFTMIEIAICLGVIAVSLVAIIGVLPTGLRVQQDNRRDMLLAQDGMLLLDAIRTGRQVEDPQRPVETRSRDWPSGLDQLTNYVVAVAITNDFDGGALVFVNPHLYRGAMTPQDFPFFGRVRSDWGAVRIRPVLTNGMHIAGLLGRPKVEWRNVDPDTKVKVTNYVAALVRSVSGTASERGRSEVDPSFTWGNFGFTYVATSEVVPLETSDAFFGDYGSYTNGTYSPEEELVRSNHWRLALNQMANFSEVRLSLSGPVSLIRRDRDKRWDAGGSPPRLLRTMVNGRQFSYQVDPNDEQFIVSFFLPGNYVRVQP